LKALLEAAEMSRQAYYQAIKAERDAKDDYQRYLLVIVGLREIHPGMGLREIYRIAQPEGIGGDAFMQLGLVNGYQLQCHANPTRTTYSTKSHRYSNLLGGKWFTGVNQLWSSDITYFQLHGVTYYIVFILDVYSRRIVGWNVEANMRTESLMCALKLALETRGIENYQETLIHHSDKGTQYASNLYTEALEAQGIQISMCNEVYENTHIERVNGTIKNQYLEYWKGNITDLNSLKKQLDKAVNTYNNLRSHTSLNRLTPVQFEKRIENLQIKDRPKMQVYTNDSRYLNVTNNDIFQLKLNL
jgi:putative transposase